MASLSPRPSFGSEHEQLIEGLLAGFRVFWGLGFRGLGFRGLGFRV